MMTTDRGQQEEPAGRPANPPPMPGIVAPLAPNAAAPVISGAATLPTPGMILQLPSAATMHPAAGKPAPLTPGAHRPASAAAACSRPDLAIAGIFLRTAQLAGNAGFIIDSRQPRLPIIARNSCAESLIAASRAWLTESDCVAHMTFLELHSHLLLVATDGASRCSRLTLTGDPLASRRRVALLKVPADPATPLPGDTGEAVKASQPGNSSGNGWVMLMIGRPSAWRDCDGWSVVSDHPAEIMLRFCDAADARWPR